MRTRKEIDDFKDNMFQNRDALGFEKVTEMEREFIKMVNTYKNENPNDSKSIRRWRKWYKSVKDRLHTKKIPQYELDTLKYHLETFRVKDVEYSIQRLQNWIDRMTASGYKFNDEVVLQINSTIDRYGYTFQPEEQ